MLPSKTWEPPKVAGMAENSKEEHWVLGFGIWDDKEFFSCVCHGSILALNLSAVLKIPDFRNTAEFFFNMQNEAPDPTFSGVLMKF